MDLKHKANIEKYYENTKNLQPHKDVIDFIKKNVNPGKAIDLGCGAGRNTKYLLRNGWNVIAIDKEDVSNYICEDLNKDEIERLNFSKQELENLNIEKSDLIIANYSLPFCNKNKFYEMWEKIENSILKNGYFIGNFFGINDGWAKTKSDMVFLTKDEVVSLFGKFEIVKIEEIEKMMKSGDGRMKYWHLVGVVARKR